MKTIIQQDGRYLVTCNGMLDGVTSYQVTPPGHPPVDVRYVDDLPDMSRALICSRGTKAYCLCVEAVENYRAQMRAEDDAWMRAKGFSG